MPEPVGVLVILSAQVEIGPRIALTITGGSHRMGLRTRLGICSMLVPTP